MTNKVIATDHPLTASQQQTLSALLDTILPASDDGKLPSAQELDFVDYLKEQAEDFISVIVTTIDHFDEGFSSLPFSERYALVEAFSKAEEALFGGLLFHIYSCYYQDDRVLEGIGMGTGPPFPRGNTLDSGDLSLLNPVMHKSRTYRKVDVSR